MKIKVNGKLIELNGDHQLFSLLKELSLTEKNGIAVAVNVEVVSKKNWNQFQLKEDDDVIIIEAAQGG